jgi:peptide chain release factor 1
MDLNLLIERKRERLAQLEREIADPALFENRKRAGEVMREHASIKQLLENWNELEIAQRQLDDNRELATSRDVGIAAMADDEIPDLEKRVMDLERDLQIALLPPDENEERDAIVEIRAGTGGSEAAIFAADLYRMYHRYAEAAGLKTEDLESSPSELGGLKDVIFRVSGQSVFRKLRYESGVHRVQRVPATEAQGRIHTSTATVAVLPEAEEVDIELKPEDLRIEVSRAGGPGGQGVNTTDSAVQVLHIPSGTIVRCQDGRSQIKNKERALSILRARLLERKQQEEAEKYSAQRRGQIGTGGREEKIRTYNFPQNRVTDHRVGLTLYNLDRVMDGELGELIKTLQTADMTARLQESAVASSSASAG